MQIINNATHIRQDKRCVPCLLGIAQNHDEHVSALWEHSIMISTSVSYKQHDLETNLRLA